MRRAYFRSEVFAGIFREIRLGQRPMSPTDPSAPCPKTALHSSRNFRGGKTSKFRDLQTRSRRHSDVTIIRRPLPGAGLCDWRDSPLERDSPEGQPRGGTFSLWDVGLCPPQNIVRLVFFFAGLGGPVKRQRHGGLTKGQFDYYSSVFWVLIKWTAYLMACGPPYDVCGPGRPLENGTSGSSSCAQSTNPLERDETYNMSRTRSARSARSTRTAR